MCESPFLFFRGTFHLFAADWVAGRFDAWPPGSPLRDQEVRICADVHTENFGTYGVEHHHACFGINDFDDATTGRLDLDACRATTSLILAGGQAGLAAARAFVETYVSVIGGARVPADPPPIARLLQAAEQARRPEYIQKRTNLHKGVRRFRWPHYFPLRTEHRAQVLRLLADYVGRLPRSARRGDGFFNLEDASGRIAGCASLGRLRYVALLRGEGSKEARNVILEFKESLGSALDDARGRRSKKSSCRAEEVIGATRAFQEESDPFLGFAGDGARSFQVRQLGPRDARLEEEVISKSREFRGIAATYGACLASAHRRANPRIAARLLRDVAGKYPDGFLRRTMSFALAYAQQAEEDWRLLSANRARVTAELVGN